jgi:hypothetical protein
VPLLLAGLALALYFDKLPGLQGEGNPLIKVLGRRHVARIGTKLEWIELGQREPGTDSMLAIGDFDGDGAEDFLSLDRLASGTTGLSLHKLDGTVRELALPSLPRYIDSRGFDFNNDGSDELVAPDDSRENVEATGCFNLEMLLLGWMYGSVEPGVPAQAQLSGPGHWQLVLRDSKHSQLLVYGPSANRLARLSDIGSGREFCYADADGDGADEIYFAGPESAGQGEVRLQGFRLDGTPLRLSDWPAGAVPTVAFDLNGDEREELFIGGQSYFDPASRVVTALAYPGHLGHRAPQFSAPVPFDTDGNGELEVLCRGGDGADTALLGFMQTVPMGGVRPDPGSVRCK